MIHLNIEQLKYRTMLILSVMAVVAPVVLIKNGMPPVGLWLAIPSAIYGIWWLFWNAWLRQLIEIAERQKEPGESPGPQADDQ